MTVKERLIEFLKYKKIGQKKFAQSVGLSDGYVNAIRVSIQPDTLHKIAMQYPELNIGWLITGEGEMLKSSTPETQNNDITCNNMQEALKHKDEQIQELTQRLKEKEDQLSNMLEIIKNLTEK